MISAKRMAEVLESVKGRRVLVVGDFLADRYVYGRTERVSREAPVLILRYESERLIPGQAANVVRNVCALGGAAVAAGVVGTDATGRKLVGQLRKLRADTAGLLSEKGRATATKTRIWAHAHHAASQQVVRLDRDVRQPPAGKTADRLLTFIKKKVGESDAVLLSDYGCGVLADGIAKAVIAVARAAKVPIVVDSRYGLLDFHGVTAATPNETEVAAALGVSDLDSVTAADLGRRLMRRIDCACVLVTQGAEGMTLLQKGKRLYHVPVFGPDEVADVTGAGDTVSSAFTLGLAAGLPPTEAAELANVAAGLVVMKLGTATVTPGEIMGAMRDAQGG